MARSPPCKRRKQISCSKYWDPEIKFSYLDSETKSLDLDPETKSLNLDPETKSLDLDPETKSLDLDPETKSLDLDPEIKSLDLDPEMLNQLSKFGFVRPLFWIRIQVISFRIRIRYTGSLDKDDKTGYLQ